MFGSEGPDEIVGDANAQVIYGRGGHDFIGPGGGKDVAYGGAGRDWIGYDIQVAMVIDLSRGRSWGAGYDLFYGFENAGGGNLKDTLIGDDGDNELDADDSNDRIEGRGGDDRLEGDLGYDRCFGGSGTDTSDMCEVEHDIP